MAGTSHRLCAGDSSSLAHVQTSSIALVVTSPPYPMIEMWDSLFGSRNLEIRKALEALDGDTAFSLMHADLSAVWREVARVLRPGGWACVNIGDATRKIGDRFKLYANHARVIEQFSSMGFDVLPLVLWRKQTNAPNKFMGSGMLPAGAYVTLEHEYILIMRKGPKREFRTRGEKAVRQSSALFWEERNRWFSDIWDFKGTRQLLDHPDLRERSAAFPFELPYRLISMYSVQGDTVLDPFLGTGTTTFAAMACERNSIGVDVDQALVTAAVEEAVSMKPRLNRCILDRLRDHLDFVERCRQEEKDLSHANLPHGFPVMTSQETSLELHCLETITRTGPGEIDVSYRKIPADEWRARVPASAGERSLFSTSRSGPESPATP